MSFTNTTREQDDQIRAARESTTIDDLIKIIDELDDKVSAADDALEERTAEVRALEKLLSERNAQIRDLESDLENARKSRDRVERTCAAADADAREAREALRIAEKRIDELESQIVDATV